MIDAHVHLYDTRRPQGLPYPAPGRKRIFRPMLPGDLRDVAEPCGFRGAVAIECSHWLEDNRWLLDVAAKDPFIRAVIGNLDIESPRFAEHLDRYAREPLFRGIRLRTPGRALNFAHPQLRSNVARVVSAGRVVELVVRGEELGPTSELAREMPAARFMLDHLACGSITGGKVDSVWATAMRRFAELPNVYCKFSHFTESAVVQPAPLELTYYAPTLDVVWEVFGPDRLVYGSDWPPCLESGDYCAPATLARDFLKPKGALEKVMSANAAAFYFEGSIASG